MTAKDMIKYWVVCPIIAIMLGVVAFGCASINNSMIETCLDSGRSVEYKTVTGSWFDPPAESFKCELKKKSAESAMRTDEELIEEMERLKN